MIPVMIHYLGGEGFAAWAIFLAAGAGFSMLEIGMSMTAVKFLAVPLHKNDGLQSSRVLTNALVMSFIIYLMLTPIIIWVAEPITGWMIVPDDEFLSGSKLIVFVFISVALRSFLQAGTLLLYASRKFSLFASMSFLQSLLSNLAAIVAAVLTGRLDISVVSYWTVQLFFLSIVLCASKVIFHWRVSISFLDLSIIRQLIKHGLKIQINDWAQFINFQFDKFIIGGFVGLWAVAPYEVANRSVVALRSIPASGLETFLPGAAIHEKESGAWNQYLKMTKLASYSSEPGSWSGGVAGKVCSDFAIA
jgi:O-antigen/teichoic acid export membrane protein